MTILLMEEILHQLIGSLYHYSQGLYIPGGAGFLPSTVLHSLFVFKNSSFAIGFQHEFHPSRHPHGKTPCWIVKTINLKVVLFTVQKFTQSGPLPIISRFISPLIGVLTGYPVIRPFIGAP